MDCPLTFCKENCVMPWMPPPFFSVHQRDGALLFRLEKCALSTPKAHSIKLLNLAFRMIEYFLPSSSTTTTMKVTQLITNMMTRCHKTFDMLKLSEKSH